MATREITRSPAVEDYCKAIFTLESRAEQPVATNALAERLGLRPIVEIPRPDGGVARLTRNPIGLSVTPPSYRAAPPPLPNPTASP